MLNIQAICSPFMPRNWVYIIVEQLNQDNERANLYVSLVLFCKFNLAIIKKLGMNVCICSGLNEKLFSAARRREPAKSA